MTAPLWRPLMISAKGHCDRTCQRPPLRVRCRSWSVAWCIWWRCIGCLYRYVNRFDTNDALQPSSRISLCTVQLATLNRSRCICRQTFPALPLQTLSVSATSLGMPACRSSGKPKPRPLGTTDIPRHAPPCSGVGASGNTGAIASLLIRPPQSPGKPSRR